MGIVIMPGSVIMKCGKVMMPWIINAFVVWEDYYGVVLQTAMCGDFRGGGLVTQLPFSYTLGHRLQLASSHWSLVT